MNTQVQTTRHAMMMVRIAAVVVAFLLGHHVMMAAIPDYAAAETSHHDVVKVEVCSTTEVIANAFSGPPVEHPSANLTPAGLYLVAESTATRALSPIFPESDATARRAWLQVFLNCSGNHFSLVDRS